MAVTKRVILLDHAANMWRYVFWADVPATRQAFYANAAATSQWKDASAGDITALKNGSVVEKCDTVNFVAGTNMAQAQTLLQAAWQDYQTSITNYNPWNRYGTFWDGTTWTIVTVT